MNFLFCNFNLIVGLFSGRISYSYCWKVSADGLLNQLSTHIVSDEFLGVKIAK